MKNFILSWLFFLIYLLSHGQSYYFKHYQVEDGLSNNAVFSSLQDHRGFLWFGTLDGLNRFDGYQFRVFRHDTEDSTSIGNNNIQCLSEDQNHNIWVGTTEGMFIYDPLKEEFRRFKESRSMEISDLKFDKKGNLWFIADMSLHLYNPQTKLLKVFNRKDFFDAVTIYIDENSEIWIGTVHGEIKRYISKNDNFETFSLFHEPDNVASKGITKIIDTGEGNLLVGTKSGLKSLDRLTGEYTDLLTYDANYRNVYIRDILKSKEDEFWIASEQGIYIYDTKTNTFTNLIKEYNNPWYISDNAIYTFLKDREGGIWVGTYFGGLNYYPVAYTPFEKYFPKMGQNSISGSAVREIIGDSKGNLWIGTEDSGLNKFDTRTNKFTHYKPSNDRSKFHGNNIHGLLITGDTLWVSSFEQGLALMNVNTGKVYKQNSSATDMQSNFIYHIYRTSAGQILFATAKGLYQYDRSNKRFRLVKNVPSHIFYTSIFEDSNGQIWLGTWRDGLYSFNFDSKESKVYKNHVNNPNSLSNNRVNSIFEDSYNNIWVATEEGLNKLGKDQKFFKRYTTKQNLPSNLIYMVLEDKNLNLWISTSRGLVFLNPVTQELRTYTKANGLLSDQFNYNSAYKDPQGRMYFGSTKGMISFNPSEFIKNAFIPPVILTGFQIYNQEVDIGTPSSPLKKSISYADSIVLNSHQSSFSIDFAALSYTSPEAIEYAYKMEGLDGDWTYLKSNRKAVFTELSPGEYIFRVNAYNHSGTRRGKEASIVIKILPPIWKSKWAYTIYFFTSILLVTFLVRQYHLAIRQKNRRKLTLLNHKKEKDLYDAKIDFFTNIAHEIRTPLTLIKGPFENIISNADKVPYIRKNLLIMEKNINHLLGLTDQLLDFRKTEESGFKLTFSKVNVSEILTNNYLYFKNAAEQKQIDFTLSLPDDPLYAYLDKDSIEKVISNLINNAVKYADSKISIKMQPCTIDGSPHLEIKFKNDGYLIPGHMREKVFETFFRLKESNLSYGSGLGLSLARSFAQLHNGTLELKEPEDEQNTFVLTLPIQQKQ